MVRLRQSFWSMLWFAWCPAFLVTNNQRQTTVLAVDYSKDRSTRVRPSFAAGKVPKFCSLAITPRSRNGETRKRGRERARIGQIYWTANERCHLSEAAVSIGPGIQRQGMLD